MTSDSDAEKLLKMLLSIYPIADANKAHATPFVIAYRGVEGRLVIQVIGLSLFWL